MVKSSKLEVRDPRTGLDRAIPVRSKIAHWHEQNVTVKYDGLINYNL